MKDSFDVLIIGGGIIGLALARELHRLKAGRVAIIERGRPGGEASFAAAGMLTPNAECESIDDFHQLCDSSRKLFPQFAGELLSETGIDIELDRSGTLYAAFTDADAEHLALRHARQVAAGIPVSHLSAEESLKAEPGLSAEVRGSLHFPDDWQVENRRLVTALETYASGSGVMNLITNRAVDSLIVENGSVMGAVADGERIFGAATVLATGAWTSLIKIGDEPASFKVMPIRGQMVSFKPPERLFRRVIYSPRGYLVPRADGRLLVGATVEDVGFDDRVTAEGIEALRSTAVEIAPCLMDEQIAETWSSLRPFAPDGLPILGEVEGFGNLFVATAHFRNGILLAPLTASLMADLIVNGTRSEYFVLYGPRRFEKPELGAVA